jgi:eukaryotic-like serine/threonine-protein kinase
VASRTEPQQANRSYPGTDEILPEQPAVPGDPFIGRVLSHYRLEARLGAGGMGLLYRATDLALGRAVAVKLLARHLVSDASAKARFIQEARAASALDHPNIGTVYDIGEVDGELFIVMALYEGETLKERLEKGRLPIDEAVGTLRQVALGLEAAHRAGTVHRDIKPANILMTTGGTAKIIDFGVAKLLGESQVQMTQAGQPIGTPLYMSPEQLTGERVDARSDLWSLGVLAHEVLSGVSPFQSESSAATTKGILNDDPPSLATLPGVPTWLAELVSQLLRKNPAERPQSASELLKRLDKRLPGSPVRSSAFRSAGVRRSVLAALIAVLIAVGAGGLYLYQHGSPNKLKSLVVLPFVNVAANPDAEYLSDGIAEDLINSLSQIPELRVIARTTAFRYKGKEVDFHSLGQQLSVDSVLSGRVQQVGNALVIQADLVDTATGAQLWGERYNRPLTEALQVQEEITKAIAEKLRPRLAPDVQSRVTRRYTDNSAAYELYLLGRYFLLSKRTKEGLTRSREYFQKAIGLDPNYALAYAGLAASYALETQDTSESSSEAYPQARRAALKALALDDQLTEAHVAFGLVSAFTWDWATAEKEYKRAIELGPNNPRAHHNYGAYLGDMGRIGEALAETRLAQRLDPANAVTTSNIGLYSCLLGQYERGIAAVKDALALEPNYLPAREGLARCYLQQRIYSKAIAAIKEAQSPRPKTLGLLGYAYAVSGNRDDALRVVEELKSAAETDADALIRIAQGYIGLDDKERAFEWLEKAYQRRAVWLRTLKTDFIYDPLRSDPRFKDLQRRVGLPP